MRHYRNLNVLQKTYFSRRYSMTAFDAANPSFQQKQRIIFVLGGPGAGKGKLYMLC